MHRHRAWEAERDAKWIPRDIRNQGATAEAEARSAPLSPLFAAGTDGVPQGRAKQRVMLATYTETAEPDHAAVRPRPWSAEAPLLRGPDVGAEAAPTSNEWQQDFRRWTALVENSRATDISSPPARASLTFPRFRPIFPAFVFRAAAPTLPCRLRWCVRARRPHEQKREETTA